MLLTCRLLDLERDVQSPDGLKWKRSIAGHFFWKNSVLSSIVLFLKQSFKLVPGHFCDGTGSEGRHMVKRSSPQKEQRVKFQLRSKDWHGAVRDPVAVYGSDDAARQRAGC